MRSSREVTFLVAVWFGFQYVPEIQAQADNTPASGKVNIPNQFPQSHEVSLSSHHDVKVVVSEEQNQHCFKTSILGPGESDGDLLKLYCFPGYRRSGANETCSGPQGCCHCAEGTYMPQPNDCRHCIMKRFCHDYGLEYEDFGSSTNNSECGAQIRKQQDYLTSQSTTLLKDIPTHHITDNVSSCNTELQNATNIKQPGISEVLDLLMTQRVNIIWISVADVLVVGGLVLALICVVSFRILRGKRGDRKYVNSCYELNVAGQQLDDCSSEADKLTGDSFEERAVNILNAQ